MMMPDSGGPEHTESKGEMLSVQVDAVCRHLSGLASAHKLSFACARLPKKSILYRPESTRGGRKGPDQL